MIQVEMCEGKLRFWFDPDGNLYVVCEEATLEEISLPASESDVGGEIAHWTFQADSDEAPTVEWLLAQLDQAGVPCIWKAATRRQGRHSLICWKGELAMAVDVTADAVAALRVEAYGPLDGAGFGLRLQRRDPAGRSGGRFLSLVADLVTQRYRGTCLIGQTFLSHEGWANWSSFRPTHQASG